MPLRSALPLLLALAAACSSGGDPGDGAASDAGPVAADAGAPDAGGADAGPATVCGDGKVEGAEVCDDGVNDGSYGRCRPGCTAGPAQSCGDGVVNGPEECDGTATLATQNCRDLYYELGEITCTACRIDVSGCSGHTQLPATAGTTHAAEGFTPDGAWLVYRRGTELRAWHMPTRADVKIEDAVHRVIRFKPDSTRMLYRNAAGDVRIWDFAARAAATVGNTDLYEATQLSPDWSRVALLAEPRGIRGKLLLWTADGRVEELGVNVPPAQMSADGRKLAFLDEYDFDNGGTLKVRDLDSAATVTVATGVHQLARLSPDGARVAWIANFQSATNTGDLSVTEVATNVSQSIASGAYALNFAFSPDSRRLAFIANHDAAKRSGSLRDWSSATNAVTAVEDSVGDGWLQYSPDGRHLLYFTDFNVFEGTLKSWTAQTRASTAIDSHVYANALFVQGGRLAFLANFQNGANAGDLKHRDLAVGVSTLVAGGVFRDFLASPDGTELAYWTDLDAESRRGKLHLDRISSAASEPGTEVPLRSLLFSGRRALFTRAYDVAQSKGDLAVFNRDTRAAAQLVKAGVGHHVAQPPPAAVCDRFAAYVFGDRLFIAPVP